MRFLNLDKLAFEEHEVPQLSRNWALDIDCNVTLKQMKEQVEGIVRLPRRINVDAPTNFVFNIGIIDDPENPLAQEETIDLAESIANVVNSIVFNRIYDKNGKGRNRERRLDVPREIKLNSYTAMNLLKDAINTKTVIDTFNVTIKFDLVQGDKRSSIATYNLFEQNTLNSD